VNGWLTRNNTIDAIKISTMLQRAKQRARTIKRDAIAVWIAARDPRVPWYAKLVAAAVAAYAFSPIDLIPDFVPVLGYLDDIVIVPAGILLTVRLIPPGLMKEFRAEAKRRIERPTSRIGAAAIVLLWLATLALTAWILSRYHSE
jgi:uncharacterized membrane protein YkvA (DUF1232 family)